jgi:hypothetical protein
MNVVRTFDIKIKDYELHHDRVSRETLFKLQQPMADT